MRTLEARTNFTADFTTADYHHRTSFCNNGLHMARATVQYLIHFLVVIIEIHYATGVQP